MTTTRYRVRYDWQATKLHEAIGDSDDAPILSASSDPGADWIDAAHFDGEGAEDTLGRLRRVAEACGVNPDHIWIDIASARD